MLQIAVCDDQKLFAYSVKSILDKIIDKYHMKFDVHVYLCGNRLLDDFQKGIFFDIVFLDIFMENSNGYEVASKLRETNKTSKIVFLTSTQDYVYEGYKVGASGYLLKPYDEETLTKVFLDVVKELDTPVDKTITIDYKGCITKLSLRDIEFFESRDHMIVVHTKDKTYSFYGKINQLEETYSKFDFFRCHRSYLVNIFKIDKIVNSDVVTKSNKFVPISRSQIKQLKSIFTGEKEF